MKNLTVPTPAQKAWADAELGVIIHLDVQVFEPSYSFRAQWGYTPDPSVFNPAELDTDQWIETAVAAGARYAVLAAKHCSGFSLWPTKAHSYSVASSPWRGGKGDIVGDFVASCHKYGVKPGIYASVSCNGYMNVNNPGRVRSGDPDDQRRYNEMAVTQLTELWSNYGELFEIWFDGGVLPPEEGGPDIIGLIQRLQPNAAVFQGPPACPNRVRDSGNELSTAMLPNWSTTTSAFYQRNDWSDKTAKAGDPNGDLWAPTECDIPNRKAGQAYQGGWFWRRGDEPFLYSADDLVEGYFRSVGQNANLLIGMVIDNRGLSPDADVAEFREFGRKIGGIFSEKTASISGKGASFTLPLPDNAAPNVVVLQEDLSQGERVRKFVVEASVNGRWLKVWEGTCVGHKRVERFDPLRAAALRLTVTESAGEPVIRDFGAWTADENLFSVPVDLARRSRLDIGRDAAGMVDICCSNPDLAIRFTADGSEPSDASPLFSAPVPLPDGGTIKAYSFVEGGLSRSGVTSATFGPIRTGWRIASVSLDSPFANSGAAGVAKLLDDDPRTYWHTYHTDKSKSAPVHEVVLDMGAVRELAALTFLPRSESVEGAPDRCEFHLSANGEDWTVAAQSRFDDLRSATGMRVVPLASPQSARYIRFVAKHVIDDGDYVAIAGIGAIPAKSVK